MRHPKYKQMTKVSNTNFFFVYICSLPPDNTFKLPLFFGLVPNQNLQFLQVYLNKTSLTQVLFLLIWGNSVNCGKSYRLIHLQNWAWLCPFLCLSIILTWLAVRHSLVYFLIHVTNSDQVCGNRTLEKKIGLKKICNKAQFYANIQCVQIWLS